MTNPSPRDDEYARDSFTWRRMTKVQLWGVTIFAIVVAVGLLIYSGSI